MPLGIGDERDARPAGHVHQPHHPLAAEVFYPAHGRLELGDLDVERDVACPAVGGAADAAIDPAVPSV
jgi:hypothetical protein